jgi:hypothetical protein
MKSEGMAARFYLEIGIVPAEVLVELMSTVDPVLMGLMFTGQLDERVAGAANRIVDELRVSRQYVPQYRADELIVDLCRAFGVELK